MARYLGVRDRRNVGGVLVRLTITEARCTEDGRTRTLRYWPGGNLHNAILSLDRFQTASVPSCTLFTPVTYTHGGR